MLSQTEKRKGKRDIGGGTKGGVEGTEEGTATLIRIIPMNYIRAVKNNNN